MESTALSARLLPAAADEFASMAHTRCLGEKLRTPKPTLTVGHKCNKALLEIHLPRVYTRLIILKNVKI
jgi:hypothetical protein